MRKSWNRKQDDMPEPDDWKLLTTLKSEQVAEKKQIVFFAAPVIYSLGMAKYKLQHAEEGCHLYSHCTGTYENIVCRPTYTFYGIITQDARQIKVSSLSGNVLYRQFVFPHERVRANELTSIVRAELISDNYITRGTMVKFLWDRVLVPSVIPEKAVIKERFTPGTRYTYKQPEKQAKKKRGRPQMQQISIERAFKAPRVKSPKITRPSKKPRKA